VTDYHRRGVRAHETLTETAALLACCLARGIEPCCACNDMGKAWGRLTVVGS
jgi:hypothetical protein